GSGVLRGGSPVRATFFVRALRDARFASKKNLLFRAAKHVFIRFTSLGRAKEVNIIVFAKKTMFAVLSLISKNFLQTKKERTNYPTEQPASHFFVPNKEMGERKSA
ncbi:MAG: hypothetical protein IJ344_05155, partial [Clostridia bacterium]|nr:hypothetical protein [Clostridia bacterium]